MRLFGRAMQHQAVFDQTVAWFTLCFSADQPFDIAKAARKLLVSDLAETASVPSSDEVHVSPRYFKAAKLVKLSDMLSRTNSRNPISKMLWLTFHYPRFFLPAAARGLMRAIGRKNAKDPSIESSMSTGRLAEIAEEVKRNVAAAQYKSAVFHHIEKNLYRHGFLASNAYIRLNLRSSVGWLRNKNDGSIRMRGDFGEGVVTHAQLLIHQSGVMQLLFMLPLPDKLTASSLVKYSYGENPTFAAGEYPGVLLNLANKGRKIPEDKWLGHWVEGLRGGQRWRRMEFDEPATIVDLFSLYSDAIAAVSKITVSSEWYCYPTIFIDQITCCDTEKFWLKRHAGELYKVTSRMDSDRIRASTIKESTPANTSLVDYDSVYMNVGMSTVINWRSSRSPELSQRLQRYMIIESCLLRYWQLVVIQMRLGSALRQRRPDIQQIQIETIEGMHEWSRSAITYGSAAEVADNFLDELGVNRLHQYLTESLDQLRQMQEAQDSKRASIRSIVLAMATVLITALLGLPAVSAILDVAHNTNKRSFAGWFTTPFRVVAHHGASGTWALFLCLVATVIIVSIVIVWLPRGSYFHPRMDIKDVPGAQWPSGTIRIINAPDDPAGSASQLSPPKSARSSLGKLEGLKHAYSWLSGHRRGGGPRRRLG